MVIFFSIFFLNNAYGGYFGLLKSSVTSASYYASKPFIYSFSLGYNWFLNNIIPITRTDFLNAMNEFVDMINEQSNDTTLQISFIFSQLKENTDILDQIKLKLIHTTNTTDQMGRFMRGLNNRQLKQQQCLKQQNKFIMGNILQLQKLITNQKKIFSTAAYNFSLYCTLHQNKIRQIEKNVSDNLQDYNEIVAFTTAIVNDVTKEQEQIEKSTQDAHAQLDKLHEAKDTELTIIHSLTLRCLNLDRQLKEEREKNSLLPRILGGYNQLKQTCMQLHSKVQELEEQNKVRQEFDTFSKKIKSSTSLLRD